MNVLEPAIREHATAICDAIASLPLDEQVAMLNVVREQLHQVSPFANEPVDLVLWVPAAEVHGNDYNPNHVAPPEMRLLEHSIAADGYTQPIVGHATEQGIEVVDGFHRTRIGTERPRIRKRLHGYLPITRIIAERGARRDRMAATIRHNRARGVHAVEPMVTLVADLIRADWTDTEIAAELGMDADEILRFKQATGLPGLFRDAPYSSAWE